MISWFRARATAAKALNAAQQGRLGEATALIEDVVESRPNDWAMWCTLGECRAAVGDPNGADHAFTRCLDLNQESVEAKEGMALIWAERDHNWQRSITALQETLAVTTEVGIAELTQLELAWVYYLSGDRTTAASYFDLAAGKLASPDSQEVEDAQFAECEYQQGVLYHELRNDSAAALEHLRLAINLSPESVYAKQAHTLLVKLTPG